MKRTIATPVDGQTILHSELLTRLVEPQHPMRDARDCVVRIQAGQTGGLPSGLFVDAAGSSGMLPQVHYTFRRVQPWIRQEIPSPAELDRVLRDPGAPRPSLLEYVLLLPEPYAACAPEPGAGIAQ